MTRWSNPRVPVIHVLKGSIDRETDKAICLKKITMIDGFDAEESVEDFKKLEVQWFPLSQVHKTLRSKEVGEDELHVNEWILQQKGLI